MEGMAGMSAWRGRPVLVTGATGLLGSRLVDALLGRGAEVVAIVRDHVPRSRLATDGLLSRIVVAHGDVTDYDFVERVLAEYEIASVFHLAAQTIVTIANRAPLSTFETNIKGTWVMLEAARRVATVKQVIVASSDKAYGTHVDLPYGEDAALQGRHPYDVSKSAADLIAQSYWHSFKLPVLITRCGNLFGGGDLNWNRLIPGTIRSIVHGEAPIIRSDGTMIRDYFYVDDAVDAYIDAADALTANADLGGSAFNISYERPLTVVDVVNRLLTLMDRRDLIPTILGQASNEIPAQYLHAERARRQLGWSPRVGLDEGLVRTIDWYRRFLAEPSPAEMAR
jgi:CDP-glucose 4,6-dehydratase